METTVMNTNRFNSVLSSAILSSAIAMSLLAPTGSAQAQSSLPIRAKIPFAFQAGPYKMPAGLYYVSLRRPDHAVLFEQRDPGKHAAAFLVVTPSEDGKIQTTARLVFNRYEDRYFLSAVWEENSKLGITCTPSHEEKEILRAQNQQAVTRTQLAVNADPKP
jgi:hypothetical protein